MNAKIKRPNDELKASRPTKEEVAKIPRLPISILVETFDPPITAATGLFGLFKTLSKALISFSKWDPIKEGKKFNTMINKTKDSYTYKYYCR